MYRAVKNGETFALVGTPYYIKQKGENLIPCLEAEAQGVAINSIPYNLFGREPMTHENIAGEILLVWADDGDISQHQAAEIETVKEQLAQADDTAISLYEANLAQGELNQQQEEINQQQAAINQTTDDTLIDLYEQIEGLREQQ